VPPSLTARVGRARQSDADAIAHSDLWWSNGEAALADVVQRGADIGEEHLARCNSGTASDAAYLNSVTQFQSLLILDIIEVHLRRARRRRRARGVQAADAPVVPAAVKQFLRLRWPVTSRPQSAGWMWGLKEAERRRRRMALWL
jgi:hypothetical protein